MTLFIIIYLYVCGLFILWRSESHSDMSFYELGLIIFYPLIIPVEMFLEAIERIGR